MTLESALTLLESHPWRFAKTMPENPHEYTLRKQWDDATFREVVELIRQRGEVVSFEGRRYVCLISGGWRYWTMGAPVEKTILINRAAEDASGAETECADRPSRTGEGGEV